MENINDNKNDNHLFVAVGLGFELGFLIALPLIGFLLLGIWLDKAAKTLPLFTGISLIAGLAATVVEVRKIILPFLEKRSKKHNNK
jgi:F0F1-type ATP synthase assembly protein I